MNFSKAVCFKDDCHIIKYLFFATLQAGMNHSSLSITYGRKYVAFSRSAFDNVFKLLHLK